MWRGGKKGVVERCGECVYVEGGVVERGRVTNLLVLDEFNVAYSFTTLNRSSGHHFDVF